MSTFLPRFERNSEHKMFMIGTKLVTVGVALALSGQLACAPKKDQNSTPSAPSNELVETADKLIQAHESMFARQFKASLEKAIETVKFNDLRTVKEALEASISEKEFTYNSKADTLGHILFESQLQCYSGTTLFVVSALKKIPVERWAARNLVVINTVINGESHVLPGFITREGKSFKLMGIEMTVSGAGVVDFGLTSQIHAPVRVVDALTWAKIEAARTSLTGQSQAALAVARTHKKFGIATVDATAFGTQPDRFRRANASPFAFGQNPAEVQGPRKAQVNLTQYTMNMAHEAAKAEVLDDARLPPGGVVIAEPVPGPPAPPVVQPTRIFKGPGLACQRVAKHLTSQQWKSMDLNMNGTFASGKKLVGHFELFDVNFTWQSFPRGLNIVYFGPEGQKLEDKFTILGEENGRCIMAIPQIDLALFYSGVSEAKIRLSPPEPGATSNTYRFETSWTDPEGESLVTQGTLTGGN